MFRDVAMILKLLYTLTPRRAGERENERERDRERTR